MLLLSARGNAPALGDQSGALGRYFMEHLHLRYEMGRIFWSDVEDRNRVRAAQNALFESLRHNF